MRKAIFKIIENKQVAEATWQMKLTETDDAVLCADEVVTEERKDPKPGQFVNITIEGKYLKRPLSVCDFKDGVLTIVYKIVGEGTEIMQGMKLEEKLELLLPLGNGFDVEAAGERPLLIGGGLGAAPMLYLARTLAEKGLRPHILLGFAHEKQDFISEILKEYGDVEIATVDGSLGIKGFVTDLMGPEVLGRKKEEAFTYFYTCGPEMMMQAIATKLEEAGVSGKLKGEYSFEARMGCGFGACMGCTCRTKYGNKRICKDGPVLKSGEVIW